MKTIFKNRKLHIILATALLLLLTLPVLAQTGGLFDLSWSTVDGGGGTFSTGGGFSLGGTAGQPDAGGMGGGDYVLAGGFWGGDAIQENRPPYDIQLSNTSVLEGQPVGTVVGTLSTSDPDPGDAFTYSLVSGVGDTDNGAFSIPGDQLLTAEVFDYAVKNSYAVRISTMDLGGLTFEKAFTINVQGQMEEGYVIFLPLIVK